MTDREKVKKGLDLCLTGEPARCKDCPYYAECKEARGIGPSPLRRDALELLKEQQETIASLQGTICKLNAALAEQPEQKHGRWINRDFGEWKCSACNDSWYLEVGDPEDNEMNYCPMCGAKMDEEVNEQCT